MTKGLAYLIMLRKMDSPIHSAYLCRITCSAKTAFPEASVEAFFGHGTVTLSTKKLNPIRTIFSSGKSSNITVDRRLESRGMSRYDVGRDALSFDFIYRPTPSDHGGSVKCVALQVRAIKFQIYRYSTVKMQRSAKLLFLGCVTRLLAWGASHAT